MFADEKFLSSWVFYAVFNNRHLASHLYIINEYSFVVFFYIPVEKYRPPYPIKNRKVDKMGFSIVRIMIGGIYDIRDYVTTPYMQNR